MNEVAARRGVRRRSVLLLAFAAAACSPGREVRAPETFEPLTYEYLTPIPLNVASIEVEQRPQPEVNGADMTGRDPVRPADAVARMARDRLKALGTSGRAVLVVNDASVVLRGGAYEGSIAIELDIYASPGVRAAFAEARVSGRRSVEESESTPRALYELTKHLMDQLNIEFEYQVRHSLHDWLVVSPSAAPAPVQEQALPPPPPALPR